MWPRTETTTPIISTARAQRTKAVRCAETGNRRIAPMVRKKPAGNTSNPAYFMAASFQVIDAFHRSIEVGPGTDVRKKKYEWQKVNRLKRFYEF
jgi:hypothetical protein